MYNSWAGQSHVGSVDARVPFSSQHNNPHMSFVSQPSQAGKMQGGGLYNGSALSDTNNPLHNFFGMPSKTIKPNYNNSMEEDIKDMYQAYVGQSQTMERVMITKQTNTMMWPITEIMPWKVAPGMHFGWSKWIFNDEYLGDRPEQGVSRVIRNYEASGSESLKPKGLSFMMEQGFWDTEKGEMCFWLNIKQINNAVADYFAFGIIYALGQCKLPDEFRAQRGDNDQKVEDKIFENLSYFAILQRKKHGFAMLLKKAQAVMQSQARRNGNIAIMPEGSMFALQQANLDVLNVNAQEKMRIDSFGSSAVAIRESRRFLIGERQLINPLRELREWGDFTYMTATAKKDTRDIWVWNEALDFYSHLSHREMLGYTGIFEGMSGQTNATSGRTNNAKKGGGFKGITRGDVLRQRSFFHGIEDDDEQQDDDGLERVRVGTGGRYGSSRKRKFIGGDSKYEPKSDNNNKGASMQLTTLGRKWLTSKYDNWWHLCQTTGDAPLILSAVLESSKSHELTKELVTALYRDEARQLTVNLESASAAIAANEAKLKSYASALSKGVRIITQIANAHPDGKLGEDDTQKVKAITEVMATVVANSTALVNQNNQVAQENAVQLAPSGVTATVSAMINEIGVPHVPGIVSNVDVPIVVNDISGNAPAIQAAVEAVQAAGSDAPPPPPSGGPPDLESPPPSTPVRRSVPSTSNVGATYADDMARIQSGAALGGLRKVQRDANGRPIGRTAPAPTVMQGAATTAAKAIEFAKQKQIEEERVAKALANVQGGTGAGQADDDGFDDEVEEVKHSTPTTSTGKGKVPTLKGKVIPFSHTYETIQTLVEAESKKPNSTVAQDGLVDIARKLGNRSESIQSVLVYLELLTQGDIKEGIDLFHSEEYLTKAWQADTQACEASLPTHGGIVESLSSAFPSGSIGLFAPSSGTTERTVAIIRDPKTAFIVSQKYKLLLKFSDPNTAIQLINQNITKKKRAQSQKSKEAEHAMNHLSTRFALNVLSSMIIQQVFVPIGSQAEQQARANLYSQWMSRLKKDEDAFKAYQGWKDSAFCTAQIGINDQVSLLAVYVMTHYEGLASVSNPDTVEALIYSDPTVKGIVASIQTKWSTKWNFIKDDGTEEKRVIGKTAKEILDRYQQYYQHSSAANWAGKEASKTEDVAKLLNYVRTDAIAQYKAAGFPEDPMVDDGQALLMALGEFISSSSNTFPSLTLPVYRFLLQFIERTLIKYKSVGLQRSIFTPDYRHVILDALDSFFHANAHKVFQGDGDMSVAFITFVDAVHTEYTKLNADPSKAYTGPVTHNPVLDAAFVDFIKQLSAAEKQRHTSNSPVDLYYSISGFQESSLESGKFIRRTPLQRIQAGEQLSASEIRHILVERSDFSSCAFIQFILDNDLPCPLGVINFRPHIRFMSYKFILTVDGGEVGHSYFLKPNFMFAESATVKTTYGHYTVSGRPVIEDPSLVVVIPDVYVTDYAGGWDITHWDAGNPDHLAVHKQNPYTFSMYHMAVESNWVPVKSFMDITGLPLDIDRTISSMDIDIGSGGGTDIRRSYSSAAFYSSADVWHFDQFLGILQGAEAGTVGVQKRNTLCFQGYQRMIDPLNPSKNSIVCDQGPFAGAIYPGSARDRKTGGPVMKEINYADTYSAA